MFVPNIIKIHPKAVERFQSGPNWWTIEPKVCHLQCCYASKAKNKSAAVADFQKHEFTRQSREAEQEVFEEKRKFTYRLFWMQIFGAMTLAAPL